MRPQITRADERFVDRVVTVEDEAIVEALRLLLTRTKLAAEPSGAAGLAALVERRRRNSNAGTAMKMEE